MAQESVTIPVLPNHPSCQVSQVANSSAAETPVSNAWASLSCQAAICSMTCWQFLPKWEWNGMDNGYFNNLQCTSLKTQRPYVFVHHAATALEQLDPRPSWCSKHSATSPWTQSGHARWCGKYSSRATRGEGRIKHPPHSLISIYYIHYPC